MIMDRTIVLGHFFAARRVSPHAKVIDLPSHNHFHHPRLFFLAHRHCTNIDQKTVMNKRL